MRVVGIKHKLVAQCFCQMVWIAFAENGKCGHCFVSTRVRAAATCHNWSRRGVDKSLDGAYSVGTGNEMSVAVDIDFEVLRGMFIVKVGDRRCCVDYDIGPDLIDNSLHISSRDEVSGEVGDTFIAIHGRISAHNSDGRARWVIKEFLDDVVAEEATATDNKDCAKWKGRRRQRHFEIGL
jgi:hypothetical protein